MDKTELFGNTVCTLMLGSAANMIFLNRERTFMYETRLDPGERLVLQKEVRYAWQHGIARGEAP